MQLLVPTKCTYCCRLRAKQVQASPDGLDARSKYFLSVFRAYKLYCAFYKQRDVRVVDSWKIQDLTSCFPVSELQVGAKLKYGYSRDLLGCCVQLLIVTISLVKLSWYWVLGKMGHISMNQLCYFIPAPFISRSSSFLLGPKAGLALLTALIKEKVIFLAGNESLQYTVLPVCGQGGETKCKGLRLHFGSFAGLSCCRHHLFLGLWAAFLLCGWRQAWSPFTHPWNRERKDKICRKWGEFTCLGLARGPSKTSSRYCSRPVCPAGGDHSSVFYWHAGFPSPRSAYRDDQYSCFQDALTTYWLLFEPWYRSIDSFDLSVTFPVEHLMMVHPWKRLLNMLH